MPINIIKASKIPWHLRTLSFLMKNVTNESIKYEIINAYITGLNDDLSHKNVSGLNTISKIISIKNNMGSDSLNKLLYFSILPPLLFE